jgi:hypothetical protein
VGLLTAQKPLAPSLVLIDAIVHQTMVLIARLSTAAGVRSPLGHIEDQVFTGLVDALNQQGVSNKVIADMFGMALRSYRQKVQRLAEAAPSAWTTLWTAVQAFLAEREWSTRDEVLRRFKHDDEISVRGILHDLVESGLVIRSGARGDTRYRAASGEELSDLGTGPAAGEPEPQMEALVEHHRAVLNTIAAQVTGGRQGSTSAHDTGATTLTFKVWPGHPRERDVRQFLVDTRAAALRLWEEAQRSSTNEPHADAYEVQFYAGHYVVDDPA